MKNRGYACGLSRQKEATHFDAACFRSRCPGTDHAVCTVPPIEESHGIQTPPRFPTPIWLMHLWLCSDSGNMSGSLLPDSCAAKRDNTRQLRYTALALHARKTHGTFKRMRTGKVTPKQTSSNAAHICSCNLRRHGLGHFHPPRAKGLTFCNEPRSSNRPKGAKVTQKTSQVAMLENERLRFRSDRLGGKERGSTCSSVVPRMNTHRLLPVVLVQERKLMPPLHWPSQ